jgi:hypothetical protein
MPKSEKATEPRYRVLVGINYPPGNRRANVGDVVDDIPAASVPDLLTLGVIEAADTAPAAPPAAEEPPADNEGASEAHTAATSDEASGNEVAP